MRILLLLISFLSYSQQQKFIVIDEETLEFVSEVNYMLFLNKKPLLANSTSKDSVARLAKEVVFDSIAFKKFNYKDIGFSKDSLKEIVLIKKVVHELHEVLISNAKSNEIVIGEQNRFVKKRATIITKDLVYGLLFHEADLKNRQVKGLCFYIEKAKYKTKYKVKFYWAHETGNILTTQNVNLDQLLFESPVYVIEQGTKNKVEINLDEFKIDTADKDIFVCLELQGHFDANDNSINPLFDDATKLKFQLSNFTNYYSKTSDINTKQLSTTIINSNAMIMRDFATMFFKKPHKSILVAPAIVLYARKKDF